MLLLPLLLTLAHADDRPNVIFIMADDLGYADVDWKDARLHTPALHDLAFSRHSVILERSYVNQLCTPTRSALMTGYYPFRTGTQNGVFLHMEPTGVPLMFPFLPENLQRLGYATHLIGKWHLGYCRRELLPTERGFDSFYGYYGPQTGYYNHSADQWNRDLGRVVRGLDLFEETAKGESVPDFSQDGVYSTDVFANRTMRVLDSVDRSRPFFLMLSFQSVHPPLQVPKSYERHCTAFPRNSNRRTYCGMLAAMDLAVDRVVSHLKAIGLYNNTVIIFSSDNGGGAEFGASNAPLRGEKDTLWEGGTRTTTFIHAPSHIQQFAVREGMFHVVDWHATILGIAGHRIEHYGDGINQWDYIRMGRSKYRRNKFVYNIDDIGSAIRDGDFKLILGNADRKSKALPGKPRLYRISVDPSEQRDVAHLHPALVKKMQSKLVSLMKFARRTVRTPTNLWGSPERHGGAYASYWCL